MKQFYPFSFLPRLRGAIRNCGVLIAAFFIMQQGLAQPGNAHSFNGVNQYDSIFRFINGGAIAYEFSVEAWVKPNTTSGAMTILSTRGSGVGDYSFDMKLQNGNTIHGDIGDGSQWATTTADASYNYQAGRWYHIAYTVSLSTHTYKIYVNGELVGSGAINASIGVFLFDQNHKSGYIGANPRVGGEYFNGSIDEVRVYSGIISQAQVQQDMLGGANGSTISLYYNFNQSSGSTVNETSGAASGPWNATAINGPTWVESYAMAVPVISDAAILSNTSFTAKWAAPAYGTVDNYILDVSASSNFSSSLAGYPKTVSGTTTSATLTGLSSTSNYYYRVKADKNSVTGQGAYSGTKSVTPPPGNAITFDGINQYMTVDVGNENLYQVFSVEAWIMPRSVTGSQSIIASTNPDFSKSFEMELVGDSLLHANIGSIGNWVTQAADAKYKFETGTWYHVAYVVRPTGYWIYINGELAAQGSLPGTPGNFPYFVGNPYNTIYIGASKGTSKFFNGSIDEVKLYGIGISQADVRTDMLNKGASSTVDFGGVKCPFYFPFDQASGNIVYDASGQGHNGVLLNSPTWSESYAMVVPGSLNPTNITATGFTATWAAPANGITNNYYLDVASSPSFSAASMVSGYNELLVSGTSKVITGLTANTPYYFRVRANKSSVSGQGAYSVPDTVVLLSTPVITSFSPVTARVASTVTIKGVNFTGANAVSFGGTAASSFTVVNDSTITAVVGQGATGNITVSTSVASGTLPGFSVIPVITSFSPLSGPVGTSVTITGSGFSAAPQQNIVYFGGVKATVTSATSTSLSVTVPAGSINGLPVSVTASNLTAFSPLAFTQTFNANTTTVLNSSSFTLAGQVAALNLQEDGFTTGDLDGDGKSDLGIWYISGTKISILRNTTTGTAISFGNKQDIDANLANDLEFADLDGDGKLDLIILNNFSMVAYKNTSTPGTISFGEAITMTSPNGFGSLNVADMDGDGKPDIIVTRAGLVDVYKNTAQAGTFFSYTETTTSVINGLSDMVVRDLNADGKPDIVAMRYTNSSVEILTYIPNTSVPGTVSFGTFQNKTISAGPSDIKCADIDGDSKPDVIITYFSNNYFVYKLDVFINGSTASGIVLNEPVSIGRPFGRSSTKLTVADLDGDGMPDIFASDGGGGTLLKNQSTPGNVSFSGDIRLVNESNSPWATDFDNDGKADFVIVSNGLPQIYRNTIGQPGITSFSPTAAIEGKTITINGTYLTGATQVKIGDSSAVSFTVQSDNVITAVVGKGATGPISITNTQGTGSKTGFTWQQRPIISSFAPVLAIPGTNILIKGIGFTGATKISFGGVAAASYTVNSDSLITAVVSNNGNTGKVVVVTPLSSDTAAGFAMVVPVITSFSPQSALLTATITIRGTGFNSGINAVSFGGRAASSFSVVSDSVITAVIDGGHPGDIVITNGYTSASIAGFTLAAPVITGISASSAAVGSTITITGYNFSSTPGNNKVYLGAAKAQVTNATTTLLSVIVPGNATPGPIMVTANGLTAYFSQPFTPSFTGANSSLNAKSFSTPLLVDAFAYFNFYEPVYTRILDFDGDGKSDLFLQYNQEACSIIRNTSTAGSKTFTDKIGFRGYYGTPADFDGDGKIDIAIGVNVDSRKIQIYKNNGAPGTLDFGLAAEISRPGGSNGLTAGDLDGDGKPDLVAMNNGSVSVYRNTSTGTQISFGPAMIFATLTNNGGSGTEEGNFGVWDIDGDGKLDIVTIPRANSVISVLKNSSTQGAFSFGSRTDIGLPFTGVDYVVGDFNNDGKPDFASIPNVPIAVSINLNTSSAGNISFGAGQSFSLAESGGALSNIAAGDLNGDGKTDLAVANYAYAATGPLGVVSVLLNTSTGPTLSFNTKRTIPGINRPNGIAVGDLDGDGTPDIVTGTDNGTNATMLFNQITFPNITGFSPASSYTDSLVTITGANMANVNVVKFGNVPAKSFTVLDNSTVTAIVDTGTSGYLYVSSPLGADSVNGFTYNTPPTITSFTPTSAFNTQTVTISGTGFNNIKSVTFGGRAAKSFNRVNATTITAVVDSGASGNIVVVTFAGTATRTGFVYNVTPAISSFSPLQGGLKTPVTIQGSGFTNVTSIKFGNTPAFSFIVVSDSVITAVTAGGTSGVITAINPGGTATSTATFNFTTPVINSFTPIAALGDTIIISGRYFTGASAVKLGSSPASVSFILVSDSVIKAVAENNTGGTISVTTPLGTTSASGITIIQKTAPGNALNFGGSNTYVSIPTSVTGDFTIEFWMRASQPGPGGSQWHEGAGLVDGEVGGLVPDFGTSLLGDKIAFGMGAPSLGRDITITSATNVTNGHWVHVAAVRVQATGQLKLYINGVLEATGTAGSDAIVSPRITIGAIQTLAHYFNGSIDELRLFNSDRSNNIASDMISPVSLTTPGLKAYYTFEQGIAQGNNAGINKLYDQSINNNQGTLNNFILNGAVSNWVESYAMVIPVIAAPTNVSTTGLTLNWVAPALGTLDNYILDVATGPAFDTLLPGYDSKVITATSETLTGLAPGTPYWVRLRVDKNALSGQGGYSIPRKVFTYGTPVITSFTPKLGALNVEVTIKGQQLIDATAVSFGGVPAASFIVIDSSTIKAVVSTGATGEISVTAPGGTATDTGFIFQHPPVITSFTPTSASPGTVITINGTDLLGAKAVTIGGTTISTFTVVSNTKIVALLNYAASGNVTVTTIAGTATLAGFTLTTAPPPGNALNFDGSQVVAANTGQVTVAGNYTVEAWIKPNRDIKTMNIFATRSAGGDQTFDMALSAQTLHADIGTGGYWMDTRADVHFNYNSGTWYHVAYALSPSGYTIYINGEKVRVGSLSASPLLFNNVHNRITIGGIDNFGDEFFIGSIDEVKVWKTTRTAEQVKLDMRNAIVQPAQETDLAVYYDFNEGVPAADNTGITTLFDASANKLDGSLINFALTDFAVTGPVSNWVGSYAMVVPAITGITNVTATGFTVNWQLPTTAIPSAAAPEAYIVQVATDSTFNTVAATYTVTDSMHFVTGPLQPEVQYWVRVQAKENAGSIGAYGDAYTVKTLPVPVVTSFSPTSAINGDTITINGRNFYDVTSVDFGGTSAASFEIVDSFTVKAVVAGGGSGAVTLAGTNGKGSAAGFTYVLPSGTMSGPGRVCKNDHSQYYTFTGFNGKEPYTFSYQQNGQNKTVTTVSGNSVQVPVTVDDFPQNYSNLLFHVTDKDGFGQDVQVIVNTLITKPNASNTEMALCEAQLPYVWNGQSITGPGTYTFNTTNVAGCDSIATLVITAINQASASTTSVTVCSTELPYNWNGTGYTESGSYTYTTTNAAGCDSVATLLLTVKQATGSITEIFTCYENLPYHWNGNDYYNSGTYTYTTTNAEGCDSVATLVFTAGQQLSITEDVTIYSADLPYYWNGTAYNASGTYIYRAISSTGCDSTLTLNLTVLQSNVTSTTAVTVCSNTLPYNWNGSDYYASGTYNYTLPSGRPNVDSIATLELTVIDPTASTTEVTVCKASLPYTWNGTGYTASGTYTFTTTNAAGCDSVATLILHASADSTTEYVTVDQAALPYHWKGNDYTTSGLYSFVTTNQLGCDSVLLLRLRVLGIAPPASFSYTTPNRFKTGKAITNLSPSIKTAGSATTIGTTSSYLKSVKADDFGNVYVLDQSIPYVTRINPDGSNTSIGSGLNFPVSLAIDGQLNLYISDLGNNAIKKISPDGTITTLYSGYDYYFLAIASNKAGDLYAYDYFSNNVLAIDKQTGAITVVGQDTENPLALAADDAGNIYITEANTRAVVKMAPDGQKTVLNTMPGSYPIDIETDAAGNVYFYDGQTSRLQKIMPDGTVSYAGAAVTGGNGLGIDIDGNLYLGTLYNGGLVIKVQGAAGPVSSYSIDPILPTGLLFNTATGVISGTPAAASAQQTYTVKANNIAGSTIAKLDIEVIVPPVTAAPSPFSYTTPNVFVKKNAITPLSPSLVAPGTNTVFGSGYNGPQAIAMDGADNLYLADAGYPYVQKISPAGTVTGTIGSGLMFVTAIAIDGAGNIYGSDVGTNQVKKIQPDGTTSVLGTGFNIPYDLAADRNGNVYVVHQSSKLRKIAPDGTTTDFYTDPYGPTAVATDTLGNVYIGNARGEIKKIAPGNVVTTIGTIGNRINGMAVDGAGNIYATGLSNNKLYKVESDGTVTAIYTGQVALYNVVIDSKGYIYVGDNTVIKKIAGDGGPVSSYSIAPSLPAGLTFNTTTGVISGTPAQASAKTSYTVTATNIRGSSTAQLAITVLNAPGEAFGYNTPNNYIKNKAIQPLAPVLAKAQVTPGVLTSVGTGFASPSGAVQDAAGNVYVSNSGYGRIDKITPDGVTVALRSSPGFPGQLGVDASGYIYLSQAGNSSAGITKMDANGNVVATLGSGFSYAPAVAVDALGYIYVADYMNSKVKRMNRFGDSITVFGTGIYYPQGIAVDANRNVYVAEPYSNSIKKITPDGTTTTVSNSFNQPVSVAVSADGNIYVAEATNNKIRKLTPNGTITDVLTGLNNPQSVSIGVDDNLYIADTYNNQVKKLTTNANQYSNFRVNPVLPAGLNIDAVTGIISGTPTIAAPTKTYTVAVQKGDNTITAPVIITVNEPGNTIVSVCTADLPYYWNGQDYTTPGTYTVHLTSARGADSTATLVLGVKNGPSSATIDVASGADTVCYGDNKKLLITATGGAKPYMYSMDGINYQPERYFEVPGGNYKALVMDAKGCYATTNTIKIAQPSQPLTVTQLTVRTGDPNYINVTASGGFGNYTYSLNGDTYQTSNIFNNITPGVSVIKVKDAAGCITTKQGYTLSVTLTAQSDTAVCYGGTASLKVIATKGTAPYQYSIDGGNTFQASNYFKVPAGNYTAVVLDALYNYAFSNTVTITQAQELSLSTSKVAVTCNTSGSVTINATGGFGNYLYSLNGSSFQAGNTFAVNNTGLYSITVKDSAGCIAKGSVTFAPLSATLASSTTQICYGKLATFTVLARNGRAPYSYSFDGGLTFQDSAKAKLPAGTYSAVVKDATGCTAATNTIVVSQPAMPLIPAITQTDVLCKGGNDGSIKVTASGGYATAYTYAINNTYQAQNVFNGLVAGSYIIAVKDAFGCIESTRVLIKQPAEPCASLTAPVNTTSSKAALPDELKIKVYPNPTVTDFNLQVITGDSRNVVEIRVMDMNGKTIYQNRGSVLDMFKFGRTFASGMYIAEVINGNNIQRVKLVKGN